MGTVWIVYYNGDTNMADYMAIPADRTFATKAEAEKEVQLRHEAAAALEKLCDYANCANVSGYCEAQ